MQWWMAPPIPDLKRQVGAFGSFWGHLGLWCMDPSRGSLYGFGFILAHWNAFVNPETDIAAPNQTAVMIRPGRDPVLGYRDMVATRRVKLVRHAKPSKTEPNPYRLPLDGSMHQSRSVVDAG